MKFKALAFLISIGLTLGIGALGAYATATSVKTWYVTLNKPSFTPPNALFPIAWTTLYILIGIAAYRIWIKRKQVKHFPRTVATYLIQLVLNLSWSFIFFYYREVGFAFSEIIVLLLFIVINAYTFYKIDKWAGLLFIPYFLWVSFATILTYSIYTLN